MHRRIRRRSPRSPADRSGDATQSSMPSSMKGWRRGQGTLASLLLDASTHASPALAPIYGSELVVGAGGATKLDGKRRRGVLSLPGLLTYHSADQHSGPIERGLLVRRQLLCEDIAPPPANVLSNCAKPHQLERQGAHDPPEVRAAQDPGLLRGLPSRVRRDRLRNGRDGRNRTFSHDRKWGSPSTRAVSSTAPTSTGPSLALRSCRPSSPKLDVHDVLRPSVFPVRPITTRPRHRTVRD
jgi:hypothetical protein